MRSVVPIGGLRLRGNFPLKNFRLRRESLAFRLFKIRLMLLAGMGFFRKKRFSENPATNILKWIKNERKEKVKEKRPFSKDFVRILTIVNNYFEQMVRGIYENILFILSSKLSD